LSHPSVRFPRRLATGATRFRKPNRVVSGRGEKRPLGNPPDRIRGLGGRVQHGRLTGFDPGTPVAVEPVATDAVGRRFEGPWRVVGDSRGWRRSRTPRGVRHRLQVGSVRRGRESGMDGGSPLETFLHRPSPWGRTRPSDLVAGERHAADVAFRAPSGPSAALPLTTLGPECPPIPASHGGRWKRRGRSGHPTSRRPPHRIGGDRAPGRRGGDPTPARLPRRARPGGRPVAGGRSETLRPASAPVRLRPRTGHCFRVFRNPLDGVRGSPRPPRPKPEAPVPVAGSRCRLGVTATWCSRRDRLLSRSPFSPSSEARRPWILPLAPSRQGRRT
jgi:hypothetical protein